MGLDIISVFNPKEKHHKQKNADRIRSMTDSELAEIIMCPYDTKPDACIKKAAITVVWNGFRNRWSEVSYENIFYRRRISYSS